MANTSYSNSSTNNALKDEIKVLVKSEFEKSVGMVCSDEEKKKFSNLSEHYSQYISSQIIEKVENPLRDKKLTILYNHEKHFLDILKEYKEEIKFAATLQAEIRKEEAVFFSTTLKEVCNSLKEAQIDPKCQAQWICDLVSTYTSSLKLSSKLAEEHVVSLLGDIQKEAAETINKE